MIDRKLRQQTERLAIGLSAHCQDGRLIVTKNGKPFYKYRLTHSKDWMAGVLYIYDKPYYAWDATRYRRRPSRWDNEAYYLNLLAENINLTAAKFAGGVRGSTYKGAG